MRSILKLKEPYWRGSRYHIGEENDERIVIEDRKTVT